MINMLKQLFRNSSGLSNIDVLLNHERTYRGNLERQLAASQAALAKTYGELTEAKKQVQHFRSQSLRDGLTALPNSLSIRECLDRFLEDGRSTQSQIGVLFIDLDNFKSINDLYGHAVGDEVLKIVSARMKHAVRIDDRVGRLGGDEFLCLISKTGSKEGAAKVAAQILDAVRAPIQIRSLKMIMHASIGIAFFPTNASTAEGLIRRADTAMYRAKRLKTGFEFFDEAIDVI
jgi:diguanylate cyclase